MLDIDEILFASWSLLAKAQRSLRPSIELTSLLWRQIQPQLEAMKPVTNILRLMYVLPGNLTRSCICIIQAFTILYQAIVVFNVFVLWP